MEEQTLFTPYDEKMQTRQLQMLKTMVPYLAGNMQKQMAVFIQCMEVKNTMSMFQGASNGLSICEVPQGTDKRLAMLNAVRQYCSPKEQETIDLMLNLFSIIDNYDLFNN